MGERGCGERRDSHSRKRDREREYVRQNDCARPRGRDVFLKEAEIVR
jgi:hypothetical protein